MQIGYEYEIDSDSIEVNVPVSIVECNNPFCQELMVSSIRSNTLLPREYCSIECSRRCSRRIRNIEESEEKLLLSY